MRLILTILLLFFEATTADYWSDRDAILQAEASQVIGSSITLSSKEQQVNDILMIYKLEEYDNGIANPSTFLPALHFFESRRAIEKSEVFRIIKMLPKMGSLHSHFSAMVSTDFLVNLTYYDNLYACDLDATLNIQFFFDKPNDLCYWQLLSDRRSSDANFDKQLRFFMSMEVNSPENAYPDIDTAWIRFEQIFNFVGPLLAYRPALRRYLYEVFRQFHADNVMFLEIRHTFSETFDDNGTVYDAASTIQFYLDTLSEFTNDYKDFIGFFLIYSPNRHVDNETMAEKIEKYLQLKKQFPELIAGFDLVGQEDKGYPLSVFADQLAAISNRTKFFFHAGETNWNGATVDQNLLDAVLLNTSRIGHGYGLIKHPEILKLVKEKNIAIEISPISNQVLKLVHDLRNHIGSYLISNGYPVVITCDDPSFWGATGVSYDWYLAFMAMTPRNGDLRVLKQLALNSITYSSIDQPNKLYVEAIFEERWDDFLNFVIKR